MARGSDGSGEWGVRWTQFDRSNRIVKRERFFDSAEARDKFAESLSRAPHDEDFLEILAWSGPAKAGEQS
jgi:hypothetical protein